MGVRILLAILLDVRSYLIVVLLARQLREIVILLDMHGIKILRLHTNGRLTSGSLQLCLLLRGCPQNIVHQLIKVLINKHVCFGGFFKFFYVLSSFMFREVETFSDFVGFNHMVFVYSVLIAFYVNQR